MTKTNLMTEIEKWAENKSEKVAKVQEKFGKTGCSIQGGEVIEKDGKATTKMPKVIARRSYQAKNDFTANALRTILPHALKEVFSSVHQLENSVIVRGSEQDFQIKVSKLKFREESDGVAAKAVLPKAIIRIVETLNGLYVVSATDKAILVENSNFEQYEIRVIAKRDRVVL